MEEKYRTVEEAVEAYRKEAKAPEGTVETYHKEKMTTAMYLRGNQEEQEKLLRLLSTELDKRGESIYYIMRRRRRVGAETILRTTIDPKEARSLTRRIIKEHNLKVRIEVP